MQPSGGSLAGPSQFPEAASEEREAPAKETADGLAVGATRTEAPRASADEAAKTEEERERQLFAQLGFERMQLGITAKMLCQGVLALVPHLATVMSPDEVLSDPERAMALIHETSASEAHAADANDLEPCLPEISVDPERDAGQPEDEPPSVPPSPPLFSTVTSEPGARASVRAAVWRRPLSLCSLLGAVLAVATSDLSSVPAFRWGAASAAAGLLTLHMLGTRDSTRLTCVLLVAAAFALLRDAITLAPAVLSAQLDDAREGAAAVVLLAACLGVWLGTRPAADLPLRLKLLTFSLVEASVVCDNYLRHTRTGDRANLVFPKVHWHGPFVASVLVGVVARPRQRHT